MVNKNDIKLANPMTFGILTVLSFFCREYGFIFTRTKLKNVVVITNRNIDPAFVEESIVI